MRYQPDELFSSAAPYYARYRTGYPQEFIDLLVTRFRLDGTQQVLDLGTGTGQIALPLASHVARVLAVDPEPGMLSEGERLAGEQGIANITWILGDSCQLNELDLPPLTLTTMGAAFHWMDRNQVLRDLDRLIVPDGAVVVASNGAPRDSATQERQNSVSWPDVLAEIRAKYLGPARRAGSGTYTHPEKLHCEILARSPFSHIEKVEWTWTLRRDLESMVRLQFSYSFSAPAQFSSDEQRTAFESEVRSALSRQAPDGIFNVRLRTEVYIATRP